MYQVPMLSFALLALGFTGRAWAAPTAEQVAGLARVESVAMSPDGSALAYAVSTRVEGSTHAPEWTLRTQVWLVRGVGGAVVAPRQLTASESDATAPTFSPDGQSIAFLRDRAGKTAIHVLALDGGEAVPVDTKDLEPVLFAWAPDAKSFAFTAKKPMTEAEDAADLRNGAVRQFGVYRPHEVWTVAVGGGAPKRIEAVEQHTVALSFSPDGQRLAVLTSPSADPYEATMLRTPGVVDVSDGVLRPLDTVPRMAERPQWSPDGRYVAWLTTQETLSLFNRLSVAEVNGPGRQDAAAGLDGTLEDFVWNGPDRLVALGVDRTRSVLYALSVDGTQQARLPGVLDRAVMSTLMPDATGSRVATIAHGSAVPREPAWIDLTNSRSGIAARPNDISGWSLGKVEVFRWKGPKGVPLEGVLTWPPDAKEGSVPLMVFPHGGPDSVTLEGFDPWARFFAGRGYAVFRPNYRGGTGYGRAFYAANRGKLGTIEFSDIESGVDALVAEKKADAKRLVYGGWSWGGYLTAWTIGHTDRYRAAMAGAAVVDVVSQYALSDINHGVVGEWEYQGDPWRSPNKFARSNPVASLAKARTPTLVAHGEADNRVNISAAIILYRALRDVGCAVELYTYPDAPHGFRDPRHVVHLLDHWVEWYDRHLSR